MFILRMYSFPKSGVKLADQSPPSLRFHKLCYGFPITDKLSIRILDGKNFRTRILTSIKKAQTLLRSSAKNTLHNYRRLSINREINILRARTSKRGTKKCKKNTYKVVLHYFYCSNSLITVAISVQIQRRGVINTRTAISIRSCINTVRHKNKNMVIRKRIFFLVLNKSKNSHSNTVYNLNIYSLLH